MNISIVDQLNDFYESSSAHWFSIYAVCATLFSMLSNLFFIILTLSSKTLRKIKANWFLVGLAVSDFLHGSAHHAGAWAIMTGSIANRSTCTLAGFFVLNTATCSFGFPALIAADRYYKITASRNAGRWSCANSIFSDLMVLPLIVAWFTFSFMLIIPLLLDKAFGEDLQLGVCCTKPFTSVTMLLYYEITLMATFSVSLLIAAIYYRLLANYLKLHFASTTNTVTKQEEVNYTEAVMRVMKIVVIVPMITSGPVIVMSAGQMLLPHLPIWVGRVLLVPYFWSSCANPWLSITLIRPFRKRFLLLFRDGTTRVNPVTNLNVTGANVSTRSPWNY